VATSLAHEGLGARSGDDLLIADTPEEFVKRVEWLVAHESAAKEMAGRARGFVEREHGWTEMTQPLIARIDGLLSAKTPRRAD
jgi:spore maturation protein CgeB